MRAIILSGLAVATLGVPAALAAPEEDMTRQAAMAQRFDPFDKVAADDWSPAFPFPFFRTAGEGDSDKVSLLLPAGTYMVVVICNCGKIALALDSPDASAVTPDRSSDQGAMYNLTVAEAGEYKIAADMQACKEPSCGFAVKAYRKN